MVIPHVLFRWGDPTGLMDTVPLFKQDASNTSEEQEAQAGMHHDGMAWFSLPQGGACSENGLLAGA